MVAERKHCSPASVPEGRVRRLCFLGLCAARGLRQRLVRDRGACCAREMGSAVLVSVRAIQGGNGRRASCRHRIFRHWRRLRPNEVRRVRQGDRKPLGPARDFLGCLRRVSVGWSGVAILCLARRVGIPAPGKRRIGHAAFVIIERFLCAC
jgi:hypothetical protein